MAKRYRYSFAQEKYAEGGLFSIRLAVTSFVLFLIGVLLSLTVPETLGFLISGISLFAMLLSIYGFYHGLHSFSEKNRNHIVSTGGAIANGVIMVCWLGLYLIGV